MLFYHFSAAMASEWSMFFRAALYGKGKGALPLSETRLRSFVESVRRYVLYLQQQSFLQHPQQDISSHKNTRSQQSIFFSQPQPHPHPPPEPPQQHRSSSMTNMSLQPQP